MTSLATDAYFREANAALIRGDVFEALKYYTHIASDISRGHPIAFLHRSLCYLILDLPSLAVHDAYRALIAAEWAIANPKFFKQQSQIFIYKSLVEEAVEKKLLWAIEPTCRLADNSTLLGQDLCSLRISGRATLKACERDDCTAMEHPAVPSWGSAPLPKMHQPKYFKAVILSYSVLEDVIAKARYRLALALWKCGGGAIRTALDIVADAMLDLDRKTQENELAQFNMLRRTIFEYMERHNDYEDRHGIDRKHGIDGLMDTRFTRIKRQLYPLDHNSLTIDNIVEVLPQIDSCLENTIGPGYGLRAYPREGFTPRLALYIISQPSSATDFWAERTFLNASTVEAGKNFMYCYACAAGMTVDNLSCSRAIQAASTGIITDDDAPDSSEGDPPRIYEDVDAQSPGDRSDHHQSHDAAEAQQYSGSSGPSERRWRDGHVEEQSIQGADHSQRLKGGADRQSTDGDGDAIIYAEHPQPPRERSEGELSDETITGEYSIFPPGHTADMSFYIPTHRLPLASLYAESTPPKTPQAQSSPNQPLSESAKANKAYKLDFQFCVDCNESWFCSDACFRAVSEGYHRPICNKGLEEATTNTILPHQWRRHTDEENTEVDDKPGTVPLPARQMCVLLTMLRTLSYCYQRGQIPAEQPWYQLMDAKLALPKYNAETWKWNGSWTDDTVALDKIFPSILKPFETPSTDAAVSKEELDDDGTMPWSFENNVVRPLYYLYSMAPEEHDGCDTILDAYHFDGWMIETLFAKIETGLRITPHCRKQMTYKKGKLHDVKYDAFPDRLKLSDDVDDVDLRWRKEHNLAARAWVATLHPLLNCVRVAEKGEDANVKFCEDAGTVFALPLTASDPENAAPSGAEYSSSDKMDTGSAPDPAPFSVQLSTPRIRARSELVRIKEITGPTHKQRSRHDSIVNMEDLPSESVNRRKAHSRRPPRLTSSGAHTVNVLDDFTCAKFRGGFLPHHNTQGHHEDLSNYDADFEDDDVDMADTMRGAAETVFMYGGDTDEDEVATVADEENDTEEPMDIDDEDDLRRPDAEEEDMMREIGWDGQIASPPPSSDGC